jgi:Fe-S-cluster containining protein
VAKPIVEAIDCTRCGNCCRSLDVYITPEDAQTLSEAVDVPVHAVMTRYVDLDSARRVGEWGKLRQHPCPFLRGSLCSVYAHRPQTCRTYPMFTPDFRWTLEDLIDGAALCPIIFNVLERMVEITDDLSRQPQ